MDYEEALMAKAAWYYYFEGLTQQQIAERLKMSRIRVIRLLEQARGTGMIQFTLRKGNQERLEMEKALMERFGLEDAFVVPDPGDPGMVNANVAQAASMYVHDRLPEGGVINIGYGDTPSRVLNHLAMLAAKPLTCVSLTGGVSYYLPDTVSSIFNAKLHLIPAPLLASSAEMARAMLQENSVREVLRMNAVARVSVIGIGSLHESATIFKAGLLNANDLMYLKAQGAAGDVLSHFIDSEGRLLLNPIEERLIGTAMEDLKNLKNVIGVAAGVVKADAIRAVLKGRIINTLITDESTADRVLGRSAD